MTKRVLTLAILATVVTTAAADDRIELTSGDVLIGRIVEATEEQLVIEHAVLGTLTIPRGTVANLPDLELHPVDPPPPPEEMPAAADAPKWKSQFDLGFSGSQGNSRTFDFRIAFQTEHETDTDRWRIDAAYFYGKSAGETTKSEGTLGVLKDWLMPNSPWLYFAQARYDFDEFRSWTHRVSGHGGAGYEFIHTDELTLIGRIGAGASKEWERSQPIRPEGLIGGDLSWQINDKQKLAAHTTLYPDLGDFFQFRIVSGVVWNMLIDEANGISINVGVDNEYESITEGDSKHNNLKYYGGISIGF